MSTKSRRVAMPLLPGSLREAVRSLARSPAFTLTAVSSIGIAIGLATSVFSVIQGSFFTPLPYSEPDRLVELWATQQPASTQPFDFLQTERLRAWAATDLRHVTGVAGAGFVASLVMSGSDGAVRVEVEPILGDWFGTLGVAAARGRVLTPDDLRPVADPAAVVSDRFWRDRLSADADAVGQTLNLSGRSFTVVGVMPPTFTSSERVWVPAEGLPAELYPGFHVGVARLREDASVADAAAEIGRLAADEVAADSIRYGGFGATVIGMGEMGQRANRSILWILTGVVGVVVLIGMSNLANLFLVRAEERMSTLAVRSALGASSWQLSQGLAAEGISVGLGGTAIGLLLARWGKDVARAIVAEAYNAPVDPVLSFSTVGLGVGLGLALTVLVGIEPVRRLRQLNLAGLLQRRAAGATGTRGERGTRNTLVAIQVAACIVLVAVLTVLGTAYRRFGALDVGYDAERVVEAIPDYEVRGMDIPEQWALGRQVAERLRHRPEVGGVALWRGVNSPYPGRPEDWVAVEGVARELGMWEQVYQYYEVEPGTVEALGIPLVAGRTFTNADGPGAPAVGIVNVGLTEAWWPGENPVGRQIKLGRDGEWMTVVGVVEDTQNLLREFARGSNRNIRGQYWPLLLRPMSQVTTPPAGWRPCPACPSVSIAVRAAGKPADAARALREEIHALAPDLPVPTLDTMFDRQMASYMGIQIRRAGRLIAGGVTVGILLAVLGIVGVVAEGVARRTREIGVRMALGAQRWDVLRAVLRESTITALVGLSAGLAALVSLRGLLVRVLPYGVDQLAPGLLDPRVLGMAVVGVLCVISVASAGTARKALSIEPTAALRSE